MNANQIGKYGAFILMGESGNNWTGNEDLRSLLQDQQKFINKLRSKEKQEGSQG